MVFQARPVAVAVVPVSPFWLNVVVAKLLAVATCTAYDDTPDALFQLNDGGFGCERALFAGNASVGTPEAVTIVVKLQTLDHPLVPFALVAFTSQ